MKKSEPRKTTPSKSTSTSDRNRKENNRGRVKFDRRVRIKVRGRQITTDAGLLMIRELDDAIGLTDMGVIPIWTPFLTWHILSPIETFATVEAMSESRIFEDLPIIICSNFGWIPVLF